MKILTKNQKGFTPIEITIALAALAVVVGGLIAIPAIRQTWEDRSQNQKSPQVKPTLKPSLSPTPIQMPPEFLEWWSQPKTETKETRDEGLLKILPPKERSELEKAIQQAQQILKNVKIFNFSVPTTKEINENLEQFNKLTPKQMPTIPPVDIQKIEEYFKQNPPAVPHEVKDLPPEAQEYYYRKYILKDPAFQ